MITDARTAAATDALLTPDSTRIGAFTVRPFSGGDMLLCGRLDLALASNDPERIGKMTREQQAEELLQIGTLLCHPPTALKQALWKSADTVRADFIAPVLFALSPADTAELIGFVAVFFAQAAAVSIEVEPKPSDAPAGPSPQGK